MPDRRLRWVVIGLAIVVRMAAVLVLRTHLVPRSTYEHGEIAANLVAGRGFSVKFLGADGPTSQQAPIYPFLVAGAYAIGGVETPRSLLILELAQGFLGGWLAAEVMGLAAAVAPGRRRTVLAAGLIAALHPTLVYAATHVQVALLAATLVTACLNRAYRAGGSGRLADSASAGVCLGLLILTDPILGLVAPGMVWIMLRCRPWAWKPILALGITAAAAVAPWVVRNARVHGEFVFVKSTFGYAFWQGNCALSEGTDKVARSSAVEILKRADGSLGDLNAKLWEARHEAGYLDDIALSKSDYQLLGSLPEPERSRVLFRRAWDDLRADPLRYPKLCLRRLRYFFLFDETNPKTRNAVYRISHVGLSATAILGLILGGAAVRRASAPLLLTVGLIGLFHSLTIVSARFHIPIEPILALFAANLAGLRISAAAGADDVEGVRVEGRLRGHRGEPLGRPGVVVIGDVA